MTGNPLDTDRFFTLKELHDLTGWPISSIRAAANAEAFPSARAKQSCNAPIRVRGRAFMAWLEELENQKISVLSPTAAGKINAQVR